MTAAAGHSGHPIIPSRDELVRNGIPPDVMLHFRDQARDLRAAAFAAAFRRVRGLLWPARARRGRFSRLDRGVAPDRIVIARG